MIMIGPAVLGNTRPVSMKKYKFFSHSRGKSPHVPVISPSGSFCSVFFFNMLFLQEMNIVKIKKFIFLKVHERMVWYLLNHFYHEMKLFFLGKIELRPNEHNA